ncbi:MAG: hypothetical protein H6726_13540 [Sandaracinaceae bacterium]|nr:hypothetical protein [Sandaracinaceae bacterium]
MSIGLPGTARRTASASTTSARNTWRAPRLVVALRTAVGACRPKQPSTDYPGRFRDVAHGRLWFAELFAWYADAHRHSGLARFTPADVFYRRIEAIANTRQRAMDTAFDAHPERFVKGRPQVRRPPAVVAINPVDPTGPMPLTELLLAGDADFMAPTPPRITKSMSVLPGALPLGAKQT